ncbi:MAG TPA: hypothetical protein VK642_06300 [Burkholderiales bacterium]|nr:hypothetical protein [Burkholderiales bacterium]
MKTPPDKAAALPTPRTNAMNTYVSKESGIVWVEKKSVQKLERELIALIDAAEKIVSNEYDYTDTLNLRKALAPFRSGK